VRFGNGEIWELGLMAGVREMNMSGMSLVAILVIILLGKGFKILQTKG